ncbi:endonuclease/exonuclease/phosphatase family protein [Mesomycoplasma ovipneumoniae]|uniref:endonuclease/exonuclease/phosphatase family protein n=1 Tax=Mesomycoplasma ovipneumoniae TaxID=29562 RepID=UPI000A4A94AB|nr:endonuclease/exonuclease/phosphatase family protein [Mesomycoplasma ovipneumoniae]
MKKAVLLPLIFAGSAAAVGTGTYFIYTSSTGEQSETGIIINKSETPPQKDLPASVDETQNQNQEKIQEPEKNVETDSSDSVEETQKQDQNQEQSQEPEKNVETDLPASVETTQQQDQNQDQNQNQEQNQDQSQEPEKNVEKDLTALVETNQQQNQNQEKIQEPEKNVETNLPASVDETQKQEQSQQPEKNVEKELSTPIDETQKQDQNQEQSQEPEKNLQKDNNQSIRVGFWNILKYTNKGKDPNSAKTYALAAVINSSGSDIVGLAEIALSGDGTDIIKELEELNPSAGWKQITTGKYGKERQQEKYTFLYKSSLLETINFEGSSNPYLIQEGINLKEWARPVAAVKFQTKTNIKNDFTLAVGHFDAPGPYNKKSNKKSNKKRNEEADSEARDQGEQEANEARDLVNVLNKIDEKDGPNNEIIFMGDTNIYGKNTEKLFKSTLESYQLLLNKDEKTSLSSKFGKYANAYDKIFYKGDLKTKNAQKYDLFPIFEKNIVDLVRYDQMREQDKRSMNYKSGDPKDVNRIKGISDHTMIYFDLELSESDKN